MFDFMKIILYSKDDYIKNAPIFQVMNLLASIQNDVEVLMDIIFRLAKVGYTYSQALDMYYGYLESNKLGDLLTLIKNKEQKIMEE